MKTPFREKNPVVLGVVSLTSIVVGIYLAMNAGNLPLIGGGTTYHAEFAEAAGIRSGEEVRIAGVKVGSITGLDLENDHVRIDFKVDDGVRVGDASRVQIKIKTLLGSHYLQLDPAGAGRQRPSVAIPRSRTSTPYEVVPAISDLSTTVGKIDTKELAKSFDTLSDTFKNSPAEIKGSLRGLQRLSETISSRDEELQKLLGRARDVTGVLAERTDSFVSLVNEGDKILKAVQARRQVIHELLINTYGVATQLNALIDENEGEIKPLLENLRKVTAVLLKNQDNLDRSLKLLAVYGREFTDATGNGRWFDSYIQNFIPIPASIGPASKDRAASKDNAKTDTLPQLP